MAKWKSLLAAIDAMTPKERILLFIALAAVCAFLSHRLILLPNDKTLHVLKQDIQGKRNQLQTLQAQMQQIAEAAGHDPDAEKRQLLDQQREHLRSLRASLSNSTSNLVPAEKMPEILRSLLEQSQNLKLVRLEGLGARMLDNDTKENKADKPTQDETHNVNHAYSHGVRLEVEGSYLAILHYLRQIERSPWTFYWSEAQLKVDKYPTVRFTVDLNTLSLSEDWIKA